MKRSSRRFGRSAENEAFELLTDGATLTGFRGECPEKVTVPEGIAKIGEKAFYACAGLKELILPGSVWKIEKSAFEDCENLREITIPANAETGENAFRQCRRLRELALPDSVVFIESSALEDCENLTIVSQAPAVIRYARENGIAIKSR